jgi:hypothetical protein
VEEDQLHEWTPRPEEGQEARAKRDAYLAGRDFHMHIHEPAASATATGNEIASTREAILAATESVTGHAAVIGLLQKLSGQVRALAAERDAPKADLRARAGLDAHDARPDTEHALRLPGEHAQDTTTVPARSIGPAAATTGTVVPAQDRAPASGRRARQLVPAGCALLLAGVAVTAFMLTRAPAAPVPLASWLQTATFNGTNSQVTVPGPVLNTGAGASFTVSAWVDLSSTSNWATAVSQDAAVSSSFFLQYSLDDDAWAFSRTSTDTVAAGAARAVSSTPPATGQWTHLVGVYNWSGRQLSLYVNGALQGTAQDPTPFAGQGDVVIGRARSNNGDSDWFPGMIKDVEIFQQALTASQVSALP